MYAKNECTYCLDEVVGVRVKCVECTDFELCLQCFAAGVEIGPHENNHSYQFINLGESEVFRTKSKWTAREEIELLNGIGKYGFGNWDDISNHIKTRTAEEAKEEYLSRYVNGTIGKCTWAEAYEKRAKFQDIGKDLPQDIPESSVSISLPLDVTPEEAAVLGFMPHRGDFEREYQNEAEKLVSQLSVKRSSDDTADELETALTLVCIDIYMDKLRERAIRKKIVNDYNLISKFFAERRERNARKRTSLDQEVEERLKWLCRFESPESHDSLVRGIQRQRDLEHRLSELLRYRRAGLTKIEEIPHYEQELARKSASGSSWEILSHQTLEKRKNDEGNDNFSTTRSFTLLTGSLGSSQGPGQQQPQRLMQFTQTLDSSHLLTPTETGICVKLEITPSQFISIKTYFLLNPFEEAGTVIEKVIQSHIMSNGWFLTPL